MKIIFKICFVIFTWISISFAQISPKIIEEIKRDYQPLSALIIGLEGNEVILDKGRAQGVKPKDIFTVYKKIKKIVHPETKETLGFLKEPIGKIEVLKVEENFATARIISKKEDFPLPTSVKRNTDLRFLIVSDGVPLDETFFITLKNLLPESEVIYEPHLRVTQLTQVDLHTRKIDVIFSLGPGFVKVYNSHLDLIRTYGSPISSPQVAILPPSPVTTPQTQTSLPQISQIIPVGKMPGEVLQAEFADLDEDGVLEMIYFTKEGLFIVKIRGPLLTKYKPEKGEILSLSVGPSGWIALNIYEKNIGMRSEVLKYTPQGLQVVLRSLNLFLQFVDYAGTGERDTLLAQTFDRENFFGKEVYIVKREGEGLRHVQRIEVPEGFRLLSANWIDLDLDGEREIAFYLPDGRLTIYKGKKEVFTTPFPVAKHFYKLTLTKGKKGQETIRAIVSPFFTPFPVDLTGDGQPELLIAKSEFPLERGAEELKTLPLNQGNFQLYYIAFQGAYFFRSLAVQENGVLTGIGGKAKELYFTFVKGLYPAQSESFLYFILY